MLSIKLNKEKLTIVRIHLERASEDLYSIYGETETGEEHYISVETSYKDALQTYLMLKPIVESEEEEIIEIR